jgi:hypothetical protein
MGAGGFESSLIGTLAGCARCQPSPHWLGHHSPIEKIRRSGLWQVQHVGAAGLTTEDREAVAGAIVTTESWRTLAMPPPP